MRYSEARGTLIYEKNLKSKISCQTPFNSVPRILSMRWKIESSWIMAKRIFLSYKTLIFKHIQYKKVQKSKSEPQKFSRLCRFKFVSRVEKIPSWTWRQEDGINYTWITELPNIGK